MIELKNDNNGFGSVHISEDVLAIIAGTAALETDGVKGAVGNMAGEIVEKFGVKNFSKGVKIALENGEIVADLALVVKSGCKIQEVSGNVQEKVKTALETMTGIPVQKVNVAVQGLEIRDEKLGAN